ncbi:MAG: short-chain dehydrogenase/reductase, partial [Paenibacillus sp.]|nr:short-chain dehydrogenase/reductase [Paenibacillus sp.]
MKGQVIAITGASSGIGAEIAVELGRRGATLALFGRNMEGLQTTASLISSRCSLYKLDVTSDQQVILAVEQVISEHG